MSLRPSEQFDLVTHINAVVIGYVLTFIALGLNIAAENRTGIIMAIVCFVLAYFHERAYLIGKTVNPNGLAALEILTIISLIGSYAIWVVT